MLTITLHQGFDTEEARCHASDAGRTCLLALTAPTVTMTTWTTITLTPAPTTTIQLTTTGPTTADPACWWWQGTFYGAVAITAEATWLQVRLGETPDAPMMGPCQQVQLFFGHELALDFPPAAGQPDAYPTWPRDDAALSDDERSFFHRGGDGILRAHGVATPIWRVEPWGMAWEEAPYVDAAPR